MVYLRQSRPTARYPFFPAAMSIPFLSARNLSKRFGSVQALDGVSIDFYGGEIHGVIGENGAGKSTFLKLLAGLETPDGGEMLVDGSAVTLRSPLDASRHGIAMIHQELSGVPDLPVSANLFLGRELSRHGILDLAAMRRETVRWLDALGGGISPDAPLGELSVAQQQRVEIAKALSRNARLLLLDEPTAVLPGDDCERLFALLGDLRRQGVALAFVSHHLEEVVRLSDRVTVLRDGRRTSMLGPFGPPAGGDGSRFPAPSPKQESAGRPTEQELAALMVGRPMDTYFPPLNPLAATPGAGGGARAPGFALEVRHWTTADVTDISLEIRPGEILGLAGLIGAGRTEFAESLFGLRPGAGEISLFGERYEPSTPLRALQAGIAYLPEDRKGAGLTVERSIRENVTLAALRDFGTWRLALDRERAAAAKAVEEFGIRTPDAESRVGSLSGGNQQKVLLAKWLQTRPRVLLVDEPTRGVDIGAKQEIYALLHRLAESGAAILLISSELNEVLGLCHRIAVLRRGRIAGVLDGPTATDRDIMGLAAL